MPRTTGSPAAGDHGVDAPGVVDGREVGVHPGGDPATRPFSCLHLRGGRLVAIDCVNRGADFLAAKKLIAEHRAIDLGRAGDPQVRPVEL